MGKNVTQPIKKSFVKSVSYDCPEPVSLSVPSSLKSAKRSNRKESLQRFNNVFVPRFIESFILVLQLVFLVVSCQYCLLAYLQC